MIKRIIIPVLIVLGCNTIFAQEFVRKMADESVNFYEVQKSFNEFYAGKPYEKGKGYKQFKRWEWFTDQRVFPSGERFASNLAWNNFMDYKKTHRSAFSAEKSAAWTSLGPNDWNSVSYSPGQGRVNVIAMDPSDTNTIFIGAPSGGLWKTTNGGLSWTVLTDNLPVLGVTGIGIDPNNSNIVYIATGDGFGSDTYSVGVLKSTDGGLSFNTTGLSFNIAQSIRPTKILMHPTNSNKHWVSTSTGVYMTIDGGANYTRTQTGFIWDLEMHPTDTNIIYASSTQFHKSTDGGVSFSLSNAGLPSRFAVNRMVIGVTPDNPAVIYGLYGASSDASFYGLYRSLDTGNTWTQMSNSPNILSSSSDGSGSGGQSWYDLAIAISPDNENEVFIGGVNLWKSIDAGVNWNISAHWVWPNTIGYTHADIHTLEFFNGYLYCGSDGGFFKSVDKGDNYIDYSRTLEISQFYKLAGSELAPNKIVGGTQDNGCMRGYIGDKEWTQVFGADGMECAIHHTDTNIIFTSSQNGGLRVSVNNGSTFRGIAGSIRNTESGAWVTPYTLDPNNPDRIVAGFENIWLSNNLGTNWVKISNFPGGPTFRTLEIAPSNSNIIYAGTQASIFKTTNLGVNWVDITNNLPGLSKTYIEINDQNPNEVWVTLSGFLAGNKVFHSTNGGSSWNNISYDLPNLPVNCIERDIRNGVLYVGTDVGIYYKKPFTFEWLPYMNGLPNVIVNELEMNYSTNKLRAATYGRGIWMADPFEYPTNKPIARFNSTNTVVCPGIPVQFNDQSLNTITSYQWLFPGGTPSQSTMANPIVTYSNSGVYDVTLIVSDGSNSDTTTLVNYLDVEVPQIENLPFSEDFELAVFPRNPVPKFSIENFDGDNTWEHMFSIPAFTYALKIDNYTTLSAGLSDVLVFPPLNFDTVNYPHLFFDVAYSGIPNFNGDTINLYYSIDCGSSRTLFATVTGTQLRSVASQSSPYEPAGQSDFKTISIPITAAANNPIVNLYLENVSGPGNILYIDNIRVEQVPVGLNSQKMDEASVTAYPNPTKGNLTINWTGYDENPIITIIDSKGQLIESYLPSEKSGQLNIDLSNQNAGLYLIRVTTKNRQETLKVVMDN
jgi:PKD repeat protein/photosystem II stability/assembly factor-like uncharacterized protein